MAKTVTFSIPDEEATLWNKFVSIAKREGKPASRLLVEVMEDYVKRHNEGNPITPLDKWLEDPAFVCFPTLGDKPTMRRLKHLPREMLKELATNASAYASTANYLLLKLNEHEQHKAMGIKYDGCIYCHDE